MVPTAASSMPYGYVAPIVASAEVMDWGVTLACWAPPRLTWKPWASPPAEPRRIGADVSDGEICAADVPDSCNHRAPVTVSPCCTGVDVTGSDVDPDLPAWANESAP